MADTTDTDQGKLSNSELLEVWIPYRLQALETLLWAYDKSHDYEQPREMQVFVEGRLLLRGNTAAMLNPMIEVGFIHARSLMEFMGLRVEKGHLAAIPSRRQDDIGIEYFRDARDAPLPKVSPQAVFTAYNGEPADAERSLVAMFDLANKGLAHLSGWNWGGYTDRELRNACEGIRVLIQNYLYTPLGIRMPDAPRSRPADASSAP
ncbi:hypothetical protein [Rhodanobacter thiooxydans]|uniref:hypothetical protein n=1 Tax=Rhodanobacter thiooxydans TaxID=416169 RepID=UPI000D3BE797|nr:hypothetical protein [Rhodanobacter thiooxydans]